MAEENEIIVEPDEGEERPVAVAPGSNLPLIILLAALTVYFAFQTVQLATERSNLGLVKANQDMAIQEAQKVQTQFKTLVTKTGQLAAQGHAGAKMAMEELQKRGLGEGPETPAPETKAPAKESKPTK